MCSLAPCRTLVYTPVLEDPHWQKGRKVYYSTRQKYPPPRIFVISSATGLRIGAQIAHEKRRSTTQAAPLYIMVCGSYDQNIFLSFSIP